MDFVLNLLITGVLYMTLPLVYVKFRGKTASNKAFGLAFINWVIMHAIFLVVYYQLFPDDISAATSTAPGLWLFLAWWYMREINESGNKKVKSKMVQTNSIENLESKFNISFKNSKRQMFKREKAKYAVFIFDFNESISRFDELRAIVVADTKTKNYRYFTIESPFGISY
ncbi:MAG: hypothetical protein RBQ97_11905, partial [Acholeplasma sp.]|nr:hypothetical protein [Acholeplasma sp.]